jgi:hypothetical protein
MAGWLERIEARPNYEHAILGYLPKEAIGRFGDLGGYMDQAERLSQLTAVVASLLDLAAICVPEVGIHLRSERPSVVGSGLSSNQTSIVGQVVSSRSLRVRQSCAERLRSLYSHGRIVAQHCLQPAMTDKPSHDRFVLPQYEPDALFGRLCAGASPEGRLYRDRRLQRMQTPQFAM